MKTAFLLLLLVVALGATSPALADEAPPARWVLEFGPYAGFYDFDQLTNMKDFGLFGARVGAHVGPWLRVEGEFDEVYTERHQTGNRARQVSFAVHARVEPFAWKVAPMALLGIGFVAFDDSDDPDAYGDALDIGLGARYLWKSRWTVRAEWMLRRQSFQLYREVEDDEGGISLVDEAVALWGRGFRVGVSHVF